MFDIGFWELAVIGVVALLVIGPERLPAVARGAGRWYGKIRYFMSSVKADIDREMRTDELRRIMSEQAKSSGIHEIFEETSELASETERAVRDSQAALDRQVQQVSAQGNKGVTASETADPAPSSPDNDKKPA